MERMGLSDIEGKATRVGASKRGSERVSKASLADLFRGRSQLLVYHARVALRAHRRATRKKRAELRRRGLPMIIWKDAKVREVPA
jgi:hypothetical protein